MHGVPTDLNLQRLVGSLIVQFGVGQFQLQLHFTSDGGGHSGSISIETGEWELRGPDGSVVDRGQEHFERDCYRIHVIIGVGVTGFAVDPPRSFTLSFASGHRLTVFDDSAQYESFAIHLPGADSIYV